MNNAVNGVAVGVKQYKIESTFLEREVMIDFYLPPSQNNSISLLLINDGQDLPLMPFTRILDSLYDQQYITSLLCAGIHCGTDRKMEYGTANTLHYAGFGGKAGAYTRFVIQELLPFIRHTFSSFSFKNISFAGFSLGGLSALDIVLNNPKEFINVGVFSGSLWWRSKKYGKGYSDDKDRIMHQQVREGGYYPWLKFFFECGTLDEVADRNNNGVIDSIDDTLDLIQELKKKGYSDDAIKYVELPEGMHNVATWARAFPQFLAWAFRNDNNRVKMPGEADNTLR
ncbi:esterase [Ilyomonas limi]|uniref:Esterase n=1 Tax=Ilyomonas limi TaxID=2575867 RepID=A0A4U3KRA3_9BACT|nr:alpha/beta hydrolase-fold protein [Ilyomonas limi]TKK64772.1 esterase [Ilyomonas limi]